MANINSPFGLRPVRYLNGAPYNGQANRYFIPSTDGTAMYLGDPVDIAGAADAVGLYPTVVKSTLADGNYSIGPVVAFEPNVATDLVYRAASTDRYCWVADDPNLVFEIQCDTVAAIAAADIGGNTIMVQTHGGSTDTGLSGIELDESGLGANASNMLYCWRGVDRDDNEPLTVHAKVLVLISMHRFKSTGDGDGILGV